MSTTQPERESLLDACVFMERLCGLESNLRLDTEDFAAVALRTSGHPGMRPMTEEQRNVVAAVCYGKANVLVNAVAGSGKTTTILQAAYALQAPTLLLTYNARLKDETRTRCKALGLSSNLEVHSYHAFGVNHYNRACHDDHGMNEVILTNKQPLSPFSYAVIVCDEAQDLTPDLFRFICKIQRDNGQHARLLLLGDERQTIFQFKGADGRFLTRAADTFTGVAPALEWASYTLRTTFRLSGSIARFMNNCVLHAPHFACPEERPRGPPVELYRGKGHACASAALKTLLKLLRSGDCRAQDIFVLAPSTRQGSSKKPQPYNVLANGLVNAGFPVFTPSEEAELNNDSVANKVVVSTYHQVKGLERKVVVVFGFSIDYFTFYARTETSLVCPNTHYVALTRATERLLLIGHDGEESRLPFLGLDDSESLNIILCGPIGGAGSAKISSVSKASVTRLTRYLSDADLRKALSFLKIRTLREPYISVKLPSRISTTFGDAELSEDVSELNGLAVPAFYEANALGCSSSLQRQCKDGMPPGDVYADEVERMDWRDSMAAYLRLAAIYGYATGGFTAKPEQLQTYDWLSDEKVVPMLAVLDTFLKGVGKVDYEADLLIKSDIRSGVQMEVSGRADAVTAEHIYELKCVQELKDEHVLQLALYGWIWEKTCVQKRGRRSLRLVNMRTGEARELIATSDELAATAKVLMDAYSRGEKLEPDDVFLRKCEQRRRPFLRSR